MKWNAIHHDLHLSILAGVWRVFAVIFASSHSTAHCILHLKGTQGEKNTGMTSCRGGKRWRGNAKENTLVEELKVQQMLENGEPTPQTFYILNLYHCNDRCSVNTKLCENGKVKGNSHIIHKVAQLITYITLIRIVLKAHGNSLMQAIWALRDQWHRVLTKTHSSVILFFFILPNTASKQTHIVPLSKSCFLWHWSNQVHPCVLLVCSTTNSEMISPHQALYCR